MGHTSAAHRRGRFALAALLLTAGLVTDSCGGGTAPGPEGGTSGSHGPGPGEPPAVTVGDDQVVTSSDTAFLPGSVSDDGLPDASELDLTWSKVSGPGEVTFGRRDEGHTSADFSATGDYVLRLTVSDGGGTTSDDLTVTVRASHATTIRVPADHPTIQAALDAAPAGALVLVSPGTYDGVVNVPRTLTLASTYYTTGDESAVEETIIRAAPSDRATVAVASSTGADTRIFGFTVTGGEDGVNVRGSAVVEHNVLTGLETDAVEYTSGASGLVQHNLMEHNGDDGVDLGDSSAVIVHNLVRDNDGDGVETRVTNRTAPVEEVIIRGNQFLGNEDDGLQIIDDDTIAESPARSATLFTIDRNVIANNEQAGLGLMDRAESSEDYRAASLVERVTVTNNTFDGNDHGITGGDNLVAVNNVFVRHAEIALKNVDGASRTAYNHFEANGTDHVGSNVDSSTAGTGDPLLDSTFTPLPGSPLIDAGTVSFSLPGGERVLVVCDHAGSAPDIGAVESGESRREGCPGEG